MTADQSTEASVGVRGDTRAGPARLWLTGWPAVVQLVLDAALAVPYLLVGVLVVVGVTTIPAFGAGLLVLALALALALGLAVFERARVLAFTGRHIAPRRPPPADQPAWRRYLLDARPWRAVAHLVAMSVWGLVGGLATVIAAALGLALATVPLYDWALPRRHLDLLGLVTVPAGWWWGPIGLLILVVLPLAALALVQVDVALARALLGQNREHREQVLRQRVETLTQTRVEAVDSVEAERRRIERDLHDGPQQKLVAIAMDLGMARGRLATDPEGAQQLVDHAHAAAKEAITEMRQVARGIHPPVLTDRGLDAALSALAAGSPVPVHVRVTLDRRPSPSAEAIAYFCVSEALTNVAKHARASQAVVEVWRSLGELVVRVRDDGIGGADLTRGTGLVGLRQRAAAIDGTVTVESPPGGGTVVTVTLPDPAPAAPAPAPERTSP